MIDRVINFGPIQQDSYYFQLIPLSLSIVNPLCQLPSQGTIYKFTVSKGSQKFDQNKIPIQANFQVVNNVPVLVINTCRLNFYLPNYVKLKKHDFSLTMVQRENNEDFQLGEYKVNVDQLVTDFKENNKSRHEYKTNFSEDYQLQFQIYVEKNRMALERNIRENKTQRINKSPLRARKEEKSDLAKKSSTGSNKQQNLTPSRDKEESLINQPPTNQNQADQEDKVENKTQINQEEKVEERPASPQPIVQEKHESVINQPNQSPKREQRRSFTKQQGSQIREKSQKNESVSRKSNDNIPLIATKQKPLYVNTPSQIRQSSTEKLGTTTVVVEPSAGLKPKQESSAKQKALLSLFFVLSIIITYLAMHPNRKV